jgi:multiple sugar transport system substrate-binding protein
MQPESARFVNLFPDELERSPPRLKLTAIGRVFVAFALAAGCSHSPPPPHRAAKPHEGLVLQVACPDQVCGAIVGRYAQAWAIESGAEVKMVQYDPNAPSPAELPGDVWIVPPGRMPHWAAAGKLQELPTAYTSPDSSYRWEEILRDWRYKLLIWDQKAYALPLIGDASLCFYRADLLSDRGNQSAFTAKYGRPLTAPRTWEDFALVAEFFHGQKRPGIDKPSPSLPPLPTSDEDLEREFYVIAASFARRAAREDEPQPPPRRELFSFHYDLESGDPRIGTAGFVHGLETLNRLQRWRKEGAAVEPPLAFQNGEAVLCLAAPSWIERFNRDPHVRGKFGFERLPGSRTVFDYENGQPRTIATGDNYVPYRGDGGYVGVVPRTCRGFDAAFTLLASLSDPKTSLDIVIEPSWGGGVFRAEHLDYRAGWQAFGLDPAQTGRLVDCIREDAVHPQVKNPVLRLRIPDEQAHQKALVEEIRSALLHGKKPSAALADAARRWREIDSMLDPRTRRLNYRLSLSLTGHE